MNILFATILFLLVGVYLFPTEAMAHLSASAQYLVQISPDHLVLASGVLLLCSLLWSFRFRQIFKDFTKGPGNFAKKSRILISFSRVTKLLAWSVHGIFGYVMASLVVLKYLDNSFRPDLPVIIAATLLLLSMLPLYFNGSPSFAREKLGSFRF
ncbi:hypothetical protein LC612_40965 [Nostoc sp. CHAB 5834]|nr:hypothetical protein [Nostoc sp. CHAB 5834]